MNHNYFRPQGRQPAVDDRWNNRDSGTGLSEDMEKYLEEIISDPQFFVF